MNLMKSYFINLNVFPKEFLGVFFLYEILVNFVYFF
jgi:hypothetical protein